MGLPNVQFHGNTMTVQELIEQLFRFDLDAEVVIPANYTFITAGPRSSTNITSVYKGTGWDRGTVFICPEANLVQLNNYQYNLFLDEIREHDWIRYDIHKGNKPRGTIPPMFNPNPPEENPDE